MNGGGHQDHTGDPTEKARQFAAEFIRRRNTWAHGEPRPATFIHDTFLASIITQMIDGRHDDGPQRVRIVLADGQSYEFDGRPIGAAEVGADDPQVDVKIEGGSVITLGALSVAATANCPPRSWFDLACFFLSKQAREAMRGDIGELRLEMQRFGYSRAWIEAATMTQLARSLFGSVGGAVKDLLAAWLKGMSTTK